MAPSSIFAAALLLASTSIALSQASTTPPAPSTTSAARAHDGQLTWYSHQSNEMRASKLIGTNVVNTANETVGEINDIILSKDGKAAALIVGVGGFLGIGERDVAVNFS